MTRDEDLIRIAKKLDKMVSRNNTEGAMDLLKELQSFNMTLKLLQETRIGMSVNNIRKHCTDEEVITLAKVLIKDWKRLLNAAAAAGQCPSEKESDLKNGLDSSKPAGTSPPTETQSLDVKRKHDSDRKPSDKSRKEKQNDRRVDKKRPSDEPGVGEKQLKDIQSEKHLKDVREEKQPPAESLKVHELPGGKHKPEPTKDRTSEDLKNISRHVEPARKTPTERHAEVKKDKNREEIRQEKRERTSRESWTDRPLDKPLFERRGVLDSSVLYPTRFPSPPRPARPLPVKRPAQDSKRDRKDSKDSSSHDPHPHPSPPVSPPSKSPAETKKERSDVHGRKITLNVAESQKLNPQTNFRRRKVPADPNAPIAPLPLHLHAPLPRKEPPDPNAPLPPLPLHLHPPPPPPQKHPSVDGKRDRDSSRKSAADSKPPPQKKSADCVKRERKDSVDNKVSKKHSDESKRERKDSSDSKTPPPKKLTVEIKKEKLRRDSCDSKPSQPVRRHSSDSKPDRRESTDSKKSGSPTAKKLAGERRESLGCKAPQPAHQQRKLSTDGAESRKGRSEAPSTPTTPTSPMSPSFSSAGGPLPPHLATGDSIRDKCIEMLAAALRTDNDYKDFGTNCDSMAAEIEDHIYQENKATDMKYKNRVRSRISNLKDPKNPELRRNVLAGSIELSRIATMSAEEMASNELKKLRNVLTQEAIREHQMAKTGGTTTDLLQCSKCKKKNCTYNQVQTRSADEPMTTFVLCNECGNRWKFC
ncbi:transcription elongation factor A protein 3 isoform X1 [Nothobranchius furzeri]|uniref:transcription elongation factor A protein 3 isoform X1 n=1 Tax=Nothobranchius furzeri TaxID=105023 RepID=UPI00077D6912